MNNIDIFNPYSNQDVTRFYVDVIVKVFEQMHVRCHYIDKMRVNARKRSIVVVSAFDAIKARILGYDIIIFWVQGVIPEESFMRNHSKARYYILSVLENLALLSSDILFFVSEEMRRHLSEKYHFSMKRHVIMPCFNETFDIAQFYRHNYKNNVFAYVGSLAKWQCFEKTVKLYKKIEIIYGDKVVLYVYTQQREDAVRILDKLGIKNYKVIFVEQSKIKDEMQKVKFGFCLREDDVVNNVATPTKLSTYVCNGVIPVYSSNIYDFHKLAKHSEFCICENDANFFEKLKWCIEHNVSKEKIIDDFQKSFGDYYNIENYIIKIHNTFKIFNSD